MAPFQGDSAASASRGASRPASAHGASQPACFTVASFNIGFHQSAMSGKKCSQHCNLFGAVCAKIVENANADLFFACEVGGHREGLRRAGIQVGDILQKPFGNEIGFAEVDNYLSVWGFGGASQPAIVFQNGDATRHTVPAGREIDAVIQRFDVQVANQQWHVVVGNMHIVAGSKNAAPKDKTRQKAVSLLRDHLESIHPQDPATPVVRIMVGDNNLKKNDVKEALQRALSKDALWEVFSSDNDGGGDNIAISGAVAEFKAIAVGANFEDRGLRYDQHDAVAVRIFPRGVTLPAELTRRNIQSQRPLSGASQPALQPAPQSALGGASQPALQPAPQPEETEEEAKGSVLRSRSPSSVAPSSLGADYSVIDVDPTDEPEDEVARHAHDLHTQMREFWDRRYDAEYDPRLLDQLSHLLFMKRKSAQPAQEDNDTAFASQEETARGILSVLRVRDEFLRSKNIDDPRHVLTEDERAELVKWTRQEYERSERQLALQERDAEKGKAKGLTPPPAEKGKAKGSRGAPQPASKGDKAKGTGKADKTKGKGQGGSLAKFLHRQKRKRRCRHLQRVCGTKQIWEVLAFSGRFDVEWLTQACLLYTSPSPRDS